MPFQVFLREEARRDIKIFLPLFVVQVGLGRHHRLQTVIRLSAIVQKSQQSASKWRVLAFFRVASRLRIKTNT